MTLWTVARQAALFMGFSRQEYWSGLPFPSPMHACMLSHVNCLLIGLTISEYKIYKIGKSLLLFKNLTFIEPFVTGTVVTASHARSR